MVKYQNIFIVLTYINSDDLINFLESAKRAVNDYKVIVVNSYHDEESKEKIKGVAKNYDCDFLNIENKGYSFGNNRGIEYALQHYDFSFLTVSNADIEIIKYTTIGLPPKGIFAGVLNARGGKYQNPMIVKENMFSEKLVYQAFSNGTRWKFVLGVGINKALRELFLKKHQSIVKNAEKNDPIKLTRIYQAHGSFITFSRSAIQKLWKGNDVDYTGIFDEKLFLFSEEGILAKRSKRLGIPVYFGNFALCNHKEDGSMKLSTLDINCELAKSNIYFYEHYCNEQ